MVVPAGLRERTLLHLTSDMPALDELFCHAGGEVGLFTFLLLEGDAASPWEGGIRFFWGAS